MKHLYIFDIHGYSANNGVGTYIKRLLDMVKTWKDFQVSMIMLQTNAEEFFVGQYQGMDYYFFPKRESVHYEDNAKEICEQLTDYIENSVDTIFLLNYAPCKTLLQALKEAFPISRRIFVIHDMRWTKPLMGDVGIFEQIIQKRKVEEQVFNTFQEEKLQFLSADNIVCLSRDTKQILTDYYHIPTERIFLIPHGMNVKECLTEEMRSVIRQKKHLGEEKILLSVGRISHSKGFFEYLEAFKLVVQKGIPCRWVIAGDLCNANQFLRLAGDAVTKITLTGVLNAGELYNWYQIADIGIFPSYFEQCSFAGLEMMSNGLPVIASDSYGVRCMFHHRENAMVIPIGDRNVPKDYQMRLADCTIELLNDRNLWELLRVNAFKRLKSDYCVQKMENAYKCLL